MTLSREPAVCFKFLLAQRDFVSCGGFRRLPMTSGLRRRRVLAHPVTKEGSMVTTVASNVLESGLRCTSKMDTVVLRRAGPRLRPGSVLQVDCGPRPSARRTESTEESSTSAAGRSRRVRSRAGSTRRAVSMSLSGSGLCRGPPEPDSRTLRAPWRPARSGIAAAMCLERVAIGVRSSWDSVRLRRGSAADFTAQLPSPSNFYPFCFLAAD